MKIDVYGNYKLMMNLPSFSGKILHIEDMLDWELYVVEKNFDYILHKQKK